MPWLETAPMEQRERFIRDWQRGLYTMTELCARYDVSRKTGYKWLARFDDGGRQALADRSRAPHHCPHRIGPDVARLIGDARRRHPSWGPGKLHSAPGIPTVRDPRRGSRRGGLGDRGGSRIVYRHVTRRGRQEEGLTTLVL